MNREQIIRALKIAIACICAVILSDILQLKNCYTAGIIAILSIQMTKRETWKKVITRGAAFLIALLIAAICFYGIGFNYYAFCAYSIAFSFLCIVLGWSDAIAMDSVLITHFITEGTMLGPIFWNEVALFLIGSGMGIIANSFLKKQMNAFSNLARMVDEDMIGILQRMSKRLLQENKTDYQADCFKILDQKLVKAKACALQNAQNVLLGQDSYEIDYIEMRMNQRYILENIYKSIKMIQTLPAQTKTVALYFEKIASEFSEENDVNELLEFGKAQIDAMKVQPLPKERNEFEARAVLYYILRQLEDFLEQKHAFVERQQFFDKI